MASASAQRVQSGPGGDYLVRDIPGGRAVKAYRCPGCDHEIRPGTAHVVVWRNDGFHGADDRRHWHTGCWNSRMTRRPSR
nr:ATP/GTP-binding protein [Smaragdicoccus niigatensis]